ncbi:hypothetical protein OSB04_012194 [Centaurea solstitialis]|uniref:Uncharacterized protein n=1 Tax=Centaurea solstitialis TaxID=347529 RepID=A0AA38TAX9_9ASTR|nr:hypothetical protein OSB04_012194 [Centaurea solstitialis]
MFNDPFWLEEIYLTTTIISMANTNHPAFAVDNIKSIIPIVLDLYEERDQYASWVELFRTHACAYDVLHHIDPSIPPPVPSVDAPTWDHIDAIVKQWIYGTISEVLVQTIILTGGASARQLWTRLEIVFQDKRRTRLLYLQKEFPNARLRGYEKVSDYCRHVKSIADGLADLGKPISEQKIVSQLISGLGDSSEYNTIKTVINQADPLPSFNAARYRLLLEETRLKWLRNYDNYGDDTKRTALLSRSLVILLAILILLIISMELKPLLSKDGSRKDDATCFERNEKRSRSNALLGIFLENNHDLVSQGLSWMKNCLVVATLIATVGFVVAYTIPDGYNG